MKNKAKARSSWLLLFRPAWSFHHRCPKPWPEEQKLKWIYSRFTVVQYDGKMKDLTDIFKQVFASNINWSITLFYLVLEKMQGNNIDLSFWEGEENWTSIIINNKIVGYVWRKYPLVVVEKKISSEIKNILKDIEGIYFIEVDLLTEDLFKIEDEKVKVYFGNFNNINSFTMEELWFLTNSI